MMNLSLYRLSVVVLQIVLAVELTPGQLPRSDGQERTITTALIIRSAPGYLETIAAKDPIEAAMVFGTWTPPNAGDLVEYNDTLNARWEQMTVDSTGWFQHPLLAGAYVYIPLHADNGEAVLLEGMGHSMVYVNGSPRAGNPYQYKETWESWEPRFDYSLIPIQFRKGRNDLLFQCNRGILKVKLHRPRSDAILNVRDVTLPDLITDSVFDVWCAIVVVNVSSSPLKDIQLRVRHPNGNENIAAVSMIPSMSIRKVGFRINGRASAKPGSYPLGLSLVSGPDSRSKVMDTAAIALRVVEEEANRKETFISAIDGSVQYYSINPAQTGDGKQTVALFLSLHGAGVEAVNQSASYYHKTWGHVVSPTNRRPYGYNWEDWGRLDAMEVLGIVRKKFAIDESRIYLTGHSMGGHGVYHIGSLFPDQFAAIGPSAGWNSFWTYRIKEKIQNPSPMRQMIQRATLPSDTYTMAHNFTQLGVYILHGSLDDNVPPQQSRMMADSLRKFHTDFVFHEQQGAGHWWDLSDEPGVDCVDWVPMFDFFARHARPLKERIRQIDFVTANPGVSAYDYWVGIEAQKEQSKLSSVNLKLDPGLRQYTATTSNVDRLSIDLSALEAPGPFNVALDSQRIESVPWPKEGKKIWLERHSGKWSVVGRPSSSLKGPHRYGTFKDAFRNRVIFVYGTKGNAEENRWSFEKARFDAERFWYQGNGSIDVVADVDFVSVTDPDRNVVLYGNAETNASWDQLLKESPVQVTRSRVRVGDRVFKGKDLSCLFVRPRAGSDLASIGVVSGTGIVGMRLTNKASYMMPGIGFPDCLVESAEVLLKGEDGVRVAGYFGLDWGVEGGDFAWTEQ